MSVVLRDPRGAGAARVLPSGAKMRLRRLFRAYVRAFHGFTAADLKDAPVRVGVAPGDLLMVHSSFDSFLGFQGGPVEGIRTLPVFTPERDPLRWKDEDGTVRVSNMRLFSLHLTAHRDLTPLAVELKRRKQWRELHVGHLRLILLRAREVYDVAETLADRGVFCYEQSVRAVPAGNWR